MKIILHQTHHQVADLEAIKDYLFEVIDNHKEQAIHLFPELFLTGYPLQDIVLHRPFIDSYQQLIADINQKLKGSQSEGLFLIGGLYYRFDDQNLPLSITNVIYKANFGEGLQRVYTKQLLPNYDIFDEDKYFLEGNGPKVLSYKGKRLACLICEDMWPSTVHPHDPVHQYKGENLDLVINLSGSPFNLGKQEKRITRAKEISNLLKAPFAYVNRVGGEDEVLFDGGSFLVNGNETIDVSPLFKKDVLTSELPEKLDSYDKVSKEPENTWESLFDPKVVTNDRPSRLKDIQDHYCEDILSALKFGLQEYAQKSGFNKFLVALSGGIDSALVVAIAKLSLREGQSLECIYMPSQYSSSQSYDLSFEMCKNLGINIKSLPIKFLHSTVKNTYLQTYNEQLEGLANENIQSRLRGSLLYARSNATNALVINTSNKSELAVGYSTLYGDSVGAISLLGDLYKLEVYKLADYINRKYDNIIPQGIIDRPPTAELKDDQQDSQSLPPYERLDPILEGILSYRLGVNDLVDQGHDIEEIKKVCGLYLKSEYKRKQFCPIIKIKAKSFGFGYRQPISKNLNYFIPRSL